MVQDHFKGSLPMIHKFFVSQLVRQQKISQLIQIRMTVLIHLSTKITTDNSFIDSDGILDIDTYPQDSSKLMTTSGSSKGNNETTVV